MPSDDDVVRLVLRFAREAFGESVVAIIEREGLRVRLRNKMRRAVRRVAGTSAGERRRGQSPG